MNIYPAIDIKSGECVRLFQGRYDRVTVYEKDPVALAKSFESQGATFLHVVDLDGAKEGLSVNLDSIINITRNTNLKIQAGGGIRSKQQMNALINAGIDKIVLGSIAITQPKMVKEWIAEFGANRIVLALDVRLDDMKIPKLALHGWQTASEKTMWQLLDEYQNSSLRHVLCTDISLDGTLRGPNIALYKECVKRYPSIQFQASGGVNTLLDLSQLSAIPVASTIVGKAFYENNFTFRAALEEVSTC